MKRGKKATIPKQYLRQLVGVRYCGIFYQEITLDLRVKETIIIIKSKLTLHVFLYESQSSNLCFGNSSLGSFYSFMFCLKLTRELLFLFLQVVAIIVVLSVP